MVYTVNGVQYTRRKKIPVTGAGSGAQTDFQIKLAATWAAAMQADFDDVRFTKADFQTLIDAWLESKVDSTSADIWVEFLNTPADSVVKTEAYMYFGNSGVASDWDGAATFLQYHGVATANFLDSLVVSPSSYVFETKARRTSSGAADNANWGLGNVQDWSDDATIIQSYAPNNRVYHQVRNEGAGTDVYEVPAFTQNQWYKGKIVYDGTTSRGYWDDNEIGSGGITTNIPNETMGLRMKIDGGTAAQDWSFARKYAANPPTYAFGTEEHQRRTPMMM